MVSAGLGSANTSIAIGLGEMNVLKASDSTMACLGLGSCIGIAAYDATANVAGMAHVVLPSSAGRVADSGAKYADTGVRRLVEGMLEHGAIKSRIIVKIAGGAQMALSSANNPVFKIGEQNIAAVEAALKKQGLRISARQTGGRRGRTLRMYASTGEVRVSVAGQSPEQL